MEGCKETDGVHVTITIKGNTGIWIFGDVDLETTISSGSHRYKIVPKEVKGKMYLFLSVRV